MAQKGQSIMILFFYVVSFSFFIKGAVAHGVPMEYQVFPNILCLFHCVPLYVCRLCINYQDLSTNLLGVAALRILLLTTFAIDFLSIRKVIIFSAIAYCHVLYTKMLQIA